MDDATSDQAIAPSTNGPLLDSPATTAGTLSLAGAAALAAAQALAKRATAPGTLRAYKADWTHFADWCVAHGFTPVPAAPAVVGAYLASLADMADARGHLLRAAFDPRLDLAGRFRGALGQCPHFGRDHREALAGITGAGRLDPRVECQ